MPHPGKSVPQIDVTIGHGMDMSWPCVEFPFPDGVTMTPGIRYSTPPSSRPLTLDLYRPAARADTPSTGLPIIIFIHGGSWARGDSRASRPLKRFPWVLASIAARGYLVASIDYRLVGEALWPAQAADTKSAIKFLRKRATEWGANPNRIATWGVSCGGHLSGIAAATAGVAELASRDPELNGIDEHVHAAVAWYGGFNMNTITRQCAEVPGCYPRTVRDMPEWNLLGGMPDELDPAYVRSAGPVHFVSGATAPMLIVVGDGDIVIPHLQSLEMAEAMRRAGAQVQLEVIVGVGHDFSGDSYEQTLAANQRAMELTMTFLDRRLTGTYV